ncbi:MAG: right-handed parallel beta-helix repeat-containing protein [Pseudobdellovibrionaceae bacterium]
MKNTITSATCIIGLLFLQQTAQAQSPQDCQVIQNLINKAAQKKSAEPVEVRVPEGDYLCKKPIIINQSNLKIIGANQNVRLKIADKKNIPAIIIGSEKTQWDAKANDFVTPYRVHHVEVDGFKVDGNKENQSDECWNGHLQKSKKDKTPRGCTDTGESAIRNNGITIRGADHIRVANVVLNNTRSGGLVTEKNCHDLVIENMTAENNFFDGFAGYQTVNSVIRKSRLSNNNGAGASLDIDYSHNRFEDVDFVNNAHQGIFARGLQGLTCDHCTIDGSGQQGIFLANSSVKPCPSEVRILNSTIKGSGRLKKDEGHGIRLNDLDCEDTCVRNTNFSKNIAGDVSIAGKEDASVAGIQCKDSAKTKSNGGPEIDGKGTQ